MITFIVVHLFFHLRVSVVLLLIFFYRFAFSCLAQQQQQLLLLLLQQQHPARMSTKIPPCVSAVFPFLVICNQSTTTTTTTTFTTITRLSSECFLNDLRILSTLTTRFLLSSYFPINLVFVVLFYVVTFPICREVFPYFRSHLCRICCEISIVCCVRFFPWRY